MRNARARVSSKQPYSTSTSTSTRTYELVLQVGTSFIPSTSPELPPAALRLVGYRYIPYMGTNPERVNTDGCTLRGGGVMT
eukprot:COSAG01_NODE_655_length_14476_cov_6.592265_6_plen_81_part_00